MAMAATRQPFAPIDSARLQNLTSLKNRQNTLSTLTSPSKRKAAAFDADIDSENVDPILFLSPKRSKAPDGDHKPVNYFLSKAPASPNVLKKPTISSSPIRRPMLAARSPAPRVNTRNIDATLSAPAGRSPTRKRVGILNRRRTAPFTRVDPPKFGSGLNFSIDAALKGTLPSYSTRPSAPELSIPVLHTEKSRDSWFFEIHEDTEEELATNLMEHGACTLDISSDEESSARVEERGKENVPPLDDISQTRTTLTSGPTSRSAESSISALKASMRASRRRAAVDDGACDVDRSPLGEMPAEDFYAEGCDGTSVFLVVDDEVPSSHGPDDEHPHHHGEEQEQEQVEPQHQLPALPTFDFTPDVKGKGPAMSVNLDIDALMQKNENDEPAPPAARLEPIEKAEEGFALWESGSDKGDE